MFYADSASKQCHCPPVASMKLPINKVRMGNKVTQGKECTCPITAALYLCIVWCALATLNCSSFSGDASGVEAPPLHTFADSAQEMDA